MSPLLRSSFGSPLPSPAHRGPGEPLATCSLEEEGTGLSQMPRLSWWPCDNAEIVGGVVEGGAQSMGSALLSMGCLWASSRVGGMWGTFLCEAVSRRVPGFGLRGLQAMTE